MLTFNEAFNRHDVDGMMKLMSADCVLENTFPAPDGTVYAGAKAVIRFWQEFFRPAPTLRKFFGLGLRRRCEWSAEDGSQGYVRGVDIFKIHEGRIREKLSYVKG